MSIWRTSVEIQHASLGGHGSNTFHFRTLTGATPGELATQLDAASVALKAFYDAIATIYPTSNNVRHEGEWITVDEVEPEAVLTAAWDSGGGGGADGLSPLLCIVVGWRSLLAAKSGRGRTFIGPVATPLAQSDGTIDTAGLATVQAAANALIAAFTGAGDGAFVVWSPTDNVGRDWVTAQVRDQFAYLSSRRD